MNRAAVDSRPRPDPADRQDGTSERSHLAFDGRGQRHPTPAAPFSELIGRSRFVVLLAVASVLLISMALFVVGAAMAVRGVVEAFQAVVTGQQASSAITVDLLEVVSVMLKAVVFYLIGIGFYSLFIAPLNVAAALGITTFNDLEIKVVSVIVVILGITFLEHYIRWEQAVETLLFGVSLAVVVAALVYFQRHSHREAVEAEHEHASMRVRAQRRLFHQDEEEREVQPDEAVEHERVEER
ncbi:MAG: YqhA family protein [Chloroflexi bacterium]|nr:YqhA family protein [Chloroflexota bacterium]